MAVLNQYSTYGTFPSQISDFFVSQLSLLDQYVFCQTGQNEWSMLVKHPFGIVELYTVDRSGQTYNNYYRSDQRVVGDFSYNISNEIYCYSNVGLGTMCHLPVYDAVIAVSVQVLVVFVCCWVMFRSIFFGRVRKK